MPYGLKDIELEKLSKVFAANERIERVVLYGSRAKGNYKPFSDVDITMMGSELTHTDLNRISFAIDDLLLPYQFDISIFHTLKNEALIDHIHRVGITIYGRESKWKENKLGEIVSIASGFAYKGEYIGKGENLLLGMGCVSYKEKFLISGARPYSGDCAERYYAHAGDIVLATRQQSDNLPILGMPAIIPTELKDKKLIVGANLYRVTNHSDFDNKYIYWLLKTPAYVRHIASCKTGTTVGMITKSDIENFVFIAPDKLGRERILETINSLDDKIDLLRRENATLESIAETLFRQWFVVEAKEEWEEKPLSSIATFLNGLACQKYPPKNGIDKLPVLKIRELSSGIGSDSDWATTEVGEEYIVHAGDVIFAWSASLMVKIWDGEDCILNQHLFKVTSHKYPKWFYYFWCKHHLNEFISIAQSHATTMGHIKRGDLDTAMVLVPSDEELLSMTAQMEGLLNKMENNNEQMSTLIQTRDGLLPRLMSNEIAM